MKLISTTILSASLTLGAAFLSASPAQAVHVQMAPGTTLDILEPTRVTCGSTKVQAVSDEIYLSKALEGEEIPTLFGVVPLVEAFEFREGYLVGLKSIFFEKYGFRAQFRLKDETTHILKKLVIENEFPEELYIRVLKIFLVN